MLNCRENQSFISDLQLPILFLLLLRLFLDISLNLRVFMQAHRVKSSVYNMLILLLHDLSVVTAYLKI